MASAEIWQRRFTRVPGPDTDTLLSVSQQQQLNDRFGQFLRQDSHWTLNTLDGILSYYYKQPKATCTLTMYAIADGTHVNRASLPNQGKDWFNPHCRLLGVVDFKAQKSPDIIFIIGSDEVSNPGRFLQVVSWDSKAFHYYAIEDINGDSGQRKWTYQASSFDAFTDGSSYDISYLGPFNGHVNGACIMKEIHKPWYHWKTPNHDLSRCLSQEQIDRLGKIPYLSDSSDPWDFFSNVESAEGLENKVITPLIQTWFALRHRNDFTVDTIGYKAQPANLNRWMAHLLLTTTINIATGQRIQTFYAADQKVSANALPWRAPTHLFMNFDLLTQDRFNDINAPLTNYSPEFKPEYYYSALQSLKISLLQEWDSKPPPQDVKVVQLQKGTLGGGKQTDSYDITNFLAVQENTEGQDIYFVALQASLEDTWGVMNLPSNLVRKELMESILLLDFYNPVYSWRRGVLMQYLPKTTTLVNGKYDMETAFIANIRNSSHASETGSPENEFLDLYDHHPSPSAIQERFKAYLGKVNNRLSTQAGVTDFLKLAESRRRIYRPLPLDEFGMTLPYALNLPVDWKLIEMKEDATVTEIPERGLNFLNCWTGSLHGYDPHLLPPDGCYAQARGGKCPRR